MYRKLKSYYVNIHLPKIMDNINQNDFKVINELEAANLGKM